MLPRLMRRDPIEGLLRRHAELDRLFDALFGETDSGAVVWGPPLDIVEEKDKVLVRVELPGVEEKDVKLNVEGHTLTIEGEKKSSYEKKEGGFHRAECFYGSFLRRVELPRSVDIEKAQATYRNGVLTVELPKKEEAKSRQIAISTGR